MESVSQSERERLTMIARLEVMLEWETVAVEANIRYIPPPLCVCVCVLARERERPQIDERA